MSGASPGAGVDATAGPAPSGGSDAALRAASTARPVRLPARARPADPTSQGPEGEPWTNDPYARALLAGRGPLHLRRVGDRVAPDGAGEEALLPLDVERWCAAPDAADTVLLSRCQGLGPVLDIGCGPGRLVAALAARGLPALGVDVSPAAVARTRRSGGAALRRSVFDRLPGEGRWGACLLIDGNIGIGGDPQALLTRALALVAPGGRLLAEAAPQDVDERLTVRVEDAHGRHGRPFPWARLGAPALLRAARAAGWTPAAGWTVHARHFVELRRPAHDPLRPPSPPEADRPFGRRGPGRRAAGRGAPGRSPLGGIPGG